MCSASFAVADVCSASFTVADVSGGVFRVGSGDELAANGLVATAVDSVPAVSMSQLEPAENNRAAKQINADV